MTSTSLVIFDLDGTILNTIADLATSTNYALAQLGFPTHPTDAYRMMVGNGVAKMFERALPAEARTPENIERMRALFVPHYDVHNADLSTPYAGIIDVMQALQQRGIQLAVASNKYQAAAEKLVAQYFPVHFVAVFGQREGIPSKPDPIIVEDILRVAGVEQSAVLYVGDSGVDMQTARNAGVRACGVTWGFRPRAELEQLAPQHIVDTPDQLLALVG
jgi:phosphoglycolate phosphatase